MYPYSPISSSLFHIPSPSLQYEHEFFQYFHEDHHLIQPAHDDQNLDTNIMADKLYKQEEDEKLVLKGCKNKKYETSSTTKKDRHSKIDTVHGPRDRRMRLSLEVARKFFNLQDLLGFDKASKTVEWLLTKSKSAVNELIHKENCSIGGAVISASSPSDSCEVISGIIDESAAINNDIHKQKKKKVKSIRRAAFHPVTAKELRKQARARARERTKIKKSLNTNNIVESMANDDLKLLGCWNPFEDHHESSIHRCSPNNMKHILGTKENFVDNCNLMDTGNWSPFTIFNYHHINTEISQEHQLTNFQYSGKLWEA